jgi:hypothetical protein
MKFQIVSEGVKGKDVVSNMHCIVEGVLVVKGVITNSGSNGEARFGKVFLRNGDDK